MSDRALQIITDAGVPGPADPLPREPMTELGYAHRLVHVYGPDLRYVPEWRQWLIWDGKRWVHDVTGQAARWTKSIARRVTADALAVVDERKREAAVRLARRGESSAGVTGALTLASTEQVIVATVDQLDADPWLLNCANGTLDLHTGKLRDPAREDLITKLAGGAYDPEATGVAFGKFFAEVQPNGEMRQYLRRLTGLGLVGKVIEHLLPIHHGEGRNGKSTFAGAVGLALGDYAAPADPDLLTARTYDAHPTGVADLFGLRVAVLHEQDAGRKLAEATVKRLTGGDRIKARRMRENFWSFDPSHTFLMLTNHKPIVVGTDEGIWRRIRLVPWDVVIRPEDDDAQLADKLALELDYILTWLVQGCLDWQASGLHDPGKVTAATATYRAESDVVSRFIASCCIPGHGTVGSTELYQAWLKWCADEGEDPGTQKAFVTQIENRGFDKKKDGTGRMRWHGLGLAAAEPEDDR